MKTKILTLLICFLIIGCKNNNEQKALNENSKEIIKEPNQLIFEVDLTTSHPDEFRFFANNVFLNNNQFMNISIGQKLNMNETSKKMVFKFPENIKPDVQLGFMLGKNSEKEIELKKMLLSYGSARFDILPDAINDYFTFNRFVNFNTTTKKLTTKKIDGNLNPMIFVRRKILDSIQNVD